ncbi:MAG: hypothetical protein Q9188_006964 [Gyalolechia gomerana]
MDQPKSFFLSLPAELRVQIYHQIWLGDKPRQTITNLAAVSRMIRAETLPILYDDFLNQRNLIPITVSSRKVTISGEEYSCSYLSLDHQRKPLPSNRRWLITLELDCLSAHTSELNTVQLLGPTSWYHYPPSQNTSQEIHDTGTLSCLQHVIIWLRRRHSQYSKHYLRLTCGCSPPGPAIRFGWPTPELPQIDSDPHILREECWYHWKIATYIDKCNFNIHMSDRQRRWRRLHTKARPYFDQSYTLAEHVGAAYPDSHMGDQRWKKAMDDAELYLKALQRTNHALLLPAEEFLANNSPPEPTFQTLREAVRWVQLNPLPFRTMGEMFQWAYLHLQS